MNVLEKKIRRERRKKHIRKKIRGTASRPRMTIYKSNKHLYIQVIDDDIANTLVSASTVEKELRNLKNKKEDAEKLGKIIGERLKKAKISEVIFDRNGYIYCGLIKAVADAARKEGVNF